ncbi:MAG: NifU family protein [Acidimicrobiia bacterium]|nr:NifU family protein [Acidimicrobiia bacterium]
MDQLVEPILEITDAARDKILEVRAAESDADTLALWVEVSGEQAGAYTYAMELRPLAGAGDGDVVQRHDDLSIVLGAESVEQLVGATLDFTSAGMVMQNPNKPLPPAVGRPDMPEPDLSSPLAQRVVAVLEEQINPAIASHGGRADLVAVEDGAAYLRLSGGCQGCGMAAATLSQGIEVAILEEIPEIDRVIDVTDHASGANPYFEAAKK